MRIAYITEWSPYGETGVIKKIVAQVEAWVSHGHEAEVFTIVPCQSHCKLFSRFTEVGKSFGVIPQRWLDALPWARLGYLNKILTAPSVRAAISAFSPDVAYYRPQGPWYPGVLTLFPRHVPLVVELNANDDTETRLWGTGLALLRRLTGSRLQKRAAAFVAVTKEIAATHGTGTALVAAIPNAMSRPFTPLPPTENENSRFVFVGSGMVAGRNWHGLDLLLRLAVALPQFQFSIVGTTADDLAGVAVPANVAFLGSLYGADLESVYAAHDVAISSLAIHRAGIREASPLKTREYLSYGLPVVVAYEEAEPRLHHVPYVLRIETQESDIESQAFAVAAFGHKWKNQRIKQDLTPLGSATIEALRLKFFAAVVEKCGQSGGIHAVH